MNGGAITVQIELMPDGRLQVKSNAPNPLLAVGMMEAAKATLLSGTAAPKQPGLSLAPASLGNQLRAQGQ